jgi:site-specific recombinase XerD
LPYDLLWPAHLEGEEEEVIMLEHYFIRPTTVDGIRESWLSEPIEGYVAWLESRSCKARTIRRRISLLTGFGEFAHSHGASRWRDLPEHIEGYVEHRLEARNTPPASDAARVQFVRDLRVPIEQLLALIVEDFEGSRHPRFETPFIDQAPAFFRYLVEERGLQPTTIKGYTHHLYRFEQYLDGIGLKALEGLSPAVISAFITQRAQGLAPASMKPLCTALRIFLRYSFREGLVDRDLGNAVESPQAYRLAHLPRSITWSDVKRTLGTVDRRSPVGKRDYAILLLLVTYGLRAREIAKLTLDSIDWRHETLHIPERKAGHATAFPLSPVVGAAVLDYLQHARPETHDRYMFWKVAAPIGPMGYSAVASRAGYYLRKAGIAVRRPGSHTLRHTCVQRLVDSDFSLDTIGDYVGHRSSASTEIYTKVDVETLRQVALGAGEELL